MKIEHEIVPADGRWTQSEMFEREVQRELLMSNSEKDEPLVANTREGVGVAKTNNLARGHWRGEMPGQKKRTQS